MTEKAVGRRGKMETPRGTVLIIGLGETGKPLLEIIENHFSAVGIDIEPSDFNGQASIMHICYPYQTDDFVGTSVGYINGDVALNVLLSNAVYIYLTRKNKISSEDKILCIK